MQLNFQVLSCKGGWHYIEVVDGLINPPLTLSAPVNQWDDCSLVQLSIVIIPQQTQLEWNQTHYKCSSLDLIFGIK